ncbi:alpha/beta fold hydrolase [Microbacterium murale]|uniref:Pimeloyl-ACP methyl ester carboxylesterase n=1 Tax=Microbacterium murale TaxID=1081040 RepID=A0ABU0P9D8_9MICO|nr:alpha/beta hydrolase [Microbacterium murale]MDQ0643951.1 pimeloyl-ACP methyl ester carboxylesterase [Microbacterium murale]
MSDEVGRALIADLCRIPNPEAIDRTTFVELGGVEQFVSIRGRDSTNPVLIVCHGGPALPSLPSSWIWQRGVEDYFTVVNYDQRASGKSAARVNDETDLSVDRYVEDLVELIAWLQGELGVRKVGVLGHSWGTILGVTLAQRRPDLLWCYIGVGQVISGPENEVESFGHAVRSATADQNDEALAELRALGEYPGAQPLTIERIVTCRKWAQHYGGLSAFRSEFAYFTDATELSPYYTDDDLELIGVGQQATMPKALPALLGFDARDQVAFDVPMVQFLGRHDWTTPTAPVERWIERVTAPSKDVVWFENSAHLCMHEEPGKFVVSLVNLALPHAAATASARGGVN